MMAYPTTELKYVYNFFLKHAYGDMSLSIFYHVGWYIGIINAKAVVSKIKPIEENVDFVFHTIRILYSTCN